MGSEPSGVAFNAFTLNAHHKPHNPFINAGAILTSALFHPDLVLAKRFKNLTDNLKDLGISKEERKRRRTEKKEREERKRRKKRKLIHLYVSWRDQDWVQSICVLVREERCPSQLCLGSLHGIFPTPRMRVEE